MKTVGISCVRDEADIIESFVRHNLNIVDKLIIIDNLSSDGTLEILVHLINEGLNIEVKSFTANDHAQEVAISSVLNNFPLKDDGYDFAVLLDADEFIAAKSRIEFCTSLQSRPDKSYPVMKWKTYLPSDVDHHLPIKNMTTIMRHHRNPEGQEFFKAIVPAICFGNCQVGRGNHLISSTKYSSLSPYLIPIPLAHFPIRSKDQAISKLILGSHTLSKKINRGEFEGLHWDYLASKIRQQNYSITNAQLVEFALFYAQNFELSPAPSLKYDPIHTFLDDKIKYHHAAKISIIGRFDAFITRLLCKEP